jgi:hypothetical protein
MGYRDLRGGFVVLMMNAGKSGLASESFEFGPSSSADEGEVQVTVKCKCKFGNR